MTDNNPAKSSNGATAQANQSAAIAPIAPHAQASALEGSNYGAATEKKIKEVIDACERYGNKAIVALAGVPGTGKSFMALIAAQRFANEPTLVREIQFHQSFSYEEFIEGMRIDITGGVSVSPGIFLEWNRCALDDPRHRYVHLRLCLICEEVFTMQGAAVHATKQCYPRTKESEPDEGTLDPCSPFLPLIESSSSPGRA